MDRRSVPDNKGEYDYAASVVWERRTENVRRFRMWEAEYKLQFQRYDGRREWLRETLIREEFNGTSRLPH